MGKLINVFESIKRASSHMSCNSSQVSRCCKNKFRKNGKFIMVVDIPGDFTPRQREKI
jgi:recombinational DNA repair protein RecR